MKKPSLIIAALIGSIIVLTLAKVIVQNRLATDGVFVAEIERKINFYKTQNAILSEDLLGASSLVSIAAKAEELGFANHGALLVLKTSKSLAVKR